MSSREQGVSGSRGGGRSLAAAEAVVLRAQCVHAAVQVAVQAVAAVAVVAVHMAAQEAAKAGYAW